MPRGRKHSEVSVILVFFCLRYCYHACISTSVAGLYRICGYIVFQNFESKWFSMSCQRFLGSCLDSSNQQHCKYILTRTREYKDLIVIKEHMPALSSSKTLTSICAPWAQPQMLTNQTTLPSPPSSPLEMSSFLSP